MIPSLTAFIPSAFPALALAHFLALISPGPDFFLIVGHAVRGRLRHSLLLCAGIAFGNAVYIGLAVIGWSALREAPLVYRVVELAGVAYLIWIGSQLIRSGMHPAAQATAEATVKNSKAASPSSRSFFAMGLASALLNPKNAVFYLTLMTVIMGPTATLAQQTFAGLWMVAVVFTWDAGLAAALGLPRTQRALGRHIPRIETAAGVFLIALAFVLLASAGLSLL